MADATESNRMRSGAEIVVRGIEPADGDECARIVYEAFGGLHDHHRFPRDFPTLEAASQLTGSFIAHPRIWGIVAEVDGQIIGSNFLDERGPITGVGPITIDPKAQGRGVGRRLMEAVIARGAEARGIRLFQDSFNMQSLSLYASLGFEVRESTVVMGGASKGGPPSGIQVRPLRVDDVEECERLCLRVHGFERTSELCDAIQTPALSPFVAVRDGRITAYATTVTFFPAAHGVAETEDDLCSLIAGTLAASEEPASFLVPTRQADLFRWCLSQGMRPVKPMTYMTIGEYREPDGGWIPSVVY
jgi:GNAT superfamily N-acetyltransferase